MKVFALTTRDDAVDFTSDDVIIDQGKVYQHKTARFNYTTYDVRRDQDVIHPSEGRVGVMVSVEASGSEDPWIYAWVLDVLHANVLFPDSDELVRIDFLCVPFSPLRMRAALRQAKISYFKTHLPRTAWQ